MRVSIIIPVYNVERYLTDCINSIVNQRFDNLEIIIINDGSTDKSINIINKLKKIYKYIKVVDQANHGLSYSRNIGIDNAKGEYIIFLDGDDYIKDSCIRECYDKCLKNNLDILAYNYVMLIESTKKFEIDYEPYGINNDLVYTGEDLFNTLIEKDIEKGYAVVYMYNRNFLINNNIKFYNGILYEDGLFICEAMLKAKRTMYTAKDYYVYRIRDGSITNSNPKELNISSNIIIINRLIDIYYDNIHRLKEHTKVNLIYRMLNVYESNLRLINLLDCDIYNCCKLRVEIKSSLTEIERLIKLERSNFNKEQIYSKLNNFKRMF